MAFRRGQSLYHAKSSHFMKLHNDSIAFSILAEASATNSKDPCSYVPRLTEAVTAMAPKPATEPTFPGLAPLKILIEVSCAAIDSQC